MKDIKAYKNKYKLLLPELPERARRLVVASDAKMLGVSGITFVHKASGISRVTIMKGIQELELGISPPAGKNRQPGGGRKQIEHTDPTVLQDLHKLVEDSSRGDPEAPLLWTLESTRTLADALAKKNHTVSHVTVAKLLKHSDYSLQANQKTKEGVDHPDRDQQFQFINSLAKKYLKAGDPVISVDTKKKELVGSYKNPGKTWLPKGQPIEVNLHDFPDPKQPKAIPYGVYDIGADHGYIGVGIDHDTAEFAVATIRLWWKHLGKKRYPKSKRLLITADAGGSNGYRLKLWKTELQKFADETGLKITVCHFPPGTSKWNKIEHRLFSFISINWKGRPLTSYKVIVNLIGSTKTKTGLKVYAALDNHKYELRKQVSKQELQALKIVRHQFHGEWNYTIKPRN
ncbi:MAG: ISAzo13 family transposase [Chloroflexi bacterium]|nr:ISAzo13 family transposase [Chloroflexota bacterium]